MPQVRHRFEVYSKLREGKGYTACGYGTVVADCVISVELIAGQVDCAVDETEKLAVIKATTGFALVDWLRTPCGA